MGGLAGVTAEITAHLHALDADIFLAINTATGGHSFTRVLGALLSSVHLKIKR
jgi:hypothetical protein